MSFKNIADTKCNEKVWKWVTPLSSYPLARWPIRLGHNISLHSPSSNQNAPYMIFKKKKKSCGSLAPSELRNPPCNWRKKLCPFIWCQRAHGVKPLQISNFPAWSRSDRQWGGGLWMPDTLTNGCRLKLWLPRWVAMRCLLLWTRELLAALLLQPLWRYPTFSFISSFA